MEAYTGEKEMEGMILDNERECHWRMIFKDNK